VYCREPEGRRPPSENEGGLRCPSCTTRSRTKLHDDPYSVYRTLRDEHPLYYLRGTRGLGPQSLRRRLGCRTRSGDVLLRAGCLSGMGEYNPDQIPVMIMMDPPRHTQLRSLVNRAFTRRRIADREPAIPRDRPGSGRGSCGGGGGDLVEDLAKPLPTIVIADLLGVPREDRKEFRHWSDQLVQDNPDDRRRRRGRWREGPALLAYFRPTSSPSGADRPETTYSPPSSPQRSMGSVSAKTNSSGCACSSSWPGTRPPPIWWSNSAVLFDQNPDQWLAVVANPSLLPGAIEECLRFDSPVQALARTLTRPVVIHGQTIEEATRSCWYTGRPIEMIESFRAGYLRHRTHRRPANSHSATASTSVWAHPSPAWRLRSFTPNSRTRTGMDGRRVSRAAALRADTRTVCACRYRSRGKSSGYCPAGLRNQEIVLPDTGVGKSLETGRQTIR